MNKLLAVLLAGAFAATLSMNVFAADAAPAAPAAKVEASTAVTAEKPSAMKHKKHAKKHAKKIEAKAEAEAPAAK